MILTLIFVVNAYCKISSSSPTSLGTCGNVRFSDGEYEIQGFTVKSEVPKLT